MNIRGQRGYFKALLSRRNLISIGRCASQMMMPFHWAMVRIVIKLKLLGFTFQRATLIQVANIIVIYYNAFKYYFFKWYPKWNGTIQICANFRFFYALWFIITQLDQQSPPPGKDPCSHKLPEFERCRLQIRPKQFLLFMYARICLVMLCSWWTVYIKDYIKGTNVLDSGDHLQRQFSCPRMK